MQRSDWKMFPILWAVALISVIGLVAPSDSQSRRQVKVVVESQQSDKQNQQAVQGSGSVIVRRGDVQPSGRLAAGDRQSKAKRSTGIFTVVQDGGESILSNATQVTYSQTAH